MQSTTETLAGDQMTHNATPAPAVSQGMAPPPPPPPSMIPPPPPPPPPLGAAITPLFKKAAAGTALEKTDRIAFMTMVSGHKKALDDLIKEELRLILSTNTEESPKKLEDIRTKIASKQWPLSDLGKKYSQAKTDLKGFLGSLEADSMTKLQNPHANFATKKSILKPGLEALTPVIEEIEALFTGRAIDLPIESEWFKVYETLKSNLLEIETDIQRIHTLTPKLDEAAKNASSTPSLAQLALSEHAKALAEVASLEAKKRGVQDKISEAIQSFRLGQAYFALVEIGLYAPINDILKTLNNVEKKTQGPAKKQKIQSEVAPREQALIDFINSGLENGSTSTGTPITDALLMQRIQDSMCQKIGARFLLLQQGYPACFKTEWSFDHVKIGTIFAEKLLNHCVLMRAEVDHKDMLKSFIASRSGSAFPPNSAPFRQTVECSIGMDLETGLPLSQEDLDRLYLDEDLDSDPDEGIDIDMDSFDPNADIDPNIFELLNSKKETVADETCSEGSEIESFENSPRP